MGRRYPPEKLVSVFERVPLFQNCSAEDLHILARNAEYHVHRKGAILLEPGRTTSWIGLMLSGRACLQTVDAAKGTRTTIDRLRAGDLFGEIGLLLGSGTPISVMAKSDCETLAIENKAFEKILRRAPDLCLAMAKRAASELVKVAVLGGEKSSGEVSKPSEQAKKPHHDPDPDVIPWVDVGSYNITPELIDMIPLQLIRKHRVLPLEIGGTSLTIGMVNPKSVEAFQEIRKVLHSVDPKIVAISADGFSQCSVALKIGTGEKKAKNPQAGLGSKLLYASEQEKKVDKSQLVIGSEVISLFDRIIVEGFERGASDIHIEPEATGVAVRYRVQGSLIARKEFISASYASSLLARLKVLAELDITDKRLPQDGRILARLGHQELNLRVSTMMIARGEKAVIRIIDSADAMRPLHQIFLNPSLEKTVRHALAEPFGAIIVAGPTGSGKSSTLYSMVNERRMSRTDTAIVTVEDPVEYLLQGITQVPINTRIGFGFPEALRGLMRQDPDVLMIGELRDPETTVMMIEAALTGHLAMTSIHGNHASAVIQRLQHLGTEPILLSQALTLIVAQRLARRLCPNCVKESEVAPALIESLVARKVISKPGSVVKLPKPSGCDGCNHTGYLGRIAVQEVMRIDEALRIALASNTPPSELIKIAQEQKCFTSFADSAAYLMARRMLSPSDALMVVAD